MGDGDPPSASLLTKALRQDRLPEVVESLERLAPVARAELFVQLKAPHQRSVLSASSTELTASLLSHVDSARLVGILTRMDPAAVVPALRLVPPDNLADILLRLPPALQATLLEGIGPPLDAEVRPLLAFDPETAGGIMTTRYVSVPDMVSVSRAIELLREIESLDSPSYLYVVDALGKLVGVVPLRNLLMANRRDPVRSVMIKEVRSLRTGSRRNEIADVFSQHPYLSLPVTDEKDRLVGIVTSDDVMAALRRGEAELIRGVTGVDPRETLPETIAAARGRLPWITVTLIGGLGCALIGGWFQWVLSEILVLGIFIPIVLAVGESIGAQTLSIMLSTLGGGRPSPAELRRLVIKECRVGLLAGAYAGVVVSLASILWHGNPGLGVLIGAVVFLSVAWAALLAAAIPSLMRRLRVNPAVAGGPLVLVLIDFSTLLIYFGSAAGCMAWIR